MLISGGDWRLLVSERDRLILFHAYIYLHFTFLFLLISLGSDSNHGLGHIIFFSFFHSSLVMASCIP